MGNIGHYASYGSDFTKQGIYALAPSGAFLGSTNTLDAKQMAEMMSKALDKWSKLKRAQRLMPSNSSAVKRLEDKYPEGGLVLHQYERDLDRPQLTGWQAGAWNQDFAWFRRDEAAAFLPSDASSGITSDVAPNLVTRLARFHLVDQVRGQGTFFAANEVQEAILTAKVKMVVNTTVYLTYTGRTRAVSADGTRGVQTSIYGEGEWETDKRKFSRLDLVAVGTRWGATTHNARGEDVGPAPIGFVFKVAGDTPAERIAPSLLFGYGW